MKGKIIKLIILLTICLISLNLFSCEPQEEFSCSEQTPYKWCEEDVFYWFNYDYPEIEIEAITYSELKIIVDTDEDKDTRFKAYLFTIFYDDLQSTKDYVATIYFKCESSKVQTKISKTNIKDLDIQEINKEKNEV